MNTSILQYLRILCVLGFYSFMSLGCYNPIQEQPPKKDDSPGPSIKEGKISVINANQQNCNPSISQDQTKYPASMMLLNFSGLFNVNVPSDVADEFDKENMIQHDRLTVVDTSNTVRWFVLRSKLNVTGVLQDPEWTTHPNYVCCVASETSDESLPFDALAIRMSDKAYLKIVKGKMICDGNPHLWINDSAGPGETVTNPEYDSETGLIKKEYVKKFFGTEKVKFIYTIPINSTGDHTLFYVDFSAENPKPIQLSKPAGKTDFMIEDPLLSPDGNWVAYGLRETTTKSEVYIQRLDQTRAPVLLASPNAFVPHWWIDPVDPFHSYYIIYCDLKGNAAFLGIDLSSSSAPKDGSLGRTLKKRLSGSPDPTAPAHMGLQPDAASADVILSNLPFKGGLSRDGKILCTTYQYSFFLTLQ